MLEVVGVGVLELVGVGVLDGVWVRGVRGGIGRGRCVRGGRY